MPDSIADIPPPDGYEQYGWTCVYHRGFCHNPSDCDFVPLFRPTAETRRGHWRAWRDLSGEERESVIARAK